MTIPAAVQILQIRAVLGLLESVFEVILYFGYSLEVIRNLEALHIYYTTLRHCRLESNRDHAP